MEIEVLEKIKEEYKKSKEKKLKYDALLETKKELEEDEKVQEYLLIIKLLNDFDLNILNKSDDDLIYDTYMKNSHKTRKTNEIYVYVGSYIYAEGINIKGTIDKKVDKNDVNADYRLYINLENFMDTKKVLIDEVAEFESTHKIVYANNRQEYSELQRQFVIESVKNGQEETIKKMIKK